MMRRLPGFFLFFITLVSTAHAIDSSSPYIEITVNGLEEVAPPLNRLADAVGKLSQSDKLSPEDQQKIIVIIDEMKLLTDKLDNSIETTKQKISQTQEEISASIKQMIFLVLLGLVVTVIIIFSAIFILFRLQISPLVNTTSSSLDKFSEAMENLSTATKIINESKQNSVDSGDTKQQPMAPSSSMEKHA